MCRIPTENFPHESPMVEKPDIDSQKQCSKHKKLGFIWASLIVASVLITCTIFVVILGLNVQKKQKLHENKTTEAAFALVVETNDVIPRKEWSDYPESDKILNLKPKSKYVIICHTAGGFCNTRKQCTNKIKWIQNFSIKKSNLYDIAYNFILGGDENIYEGRGWEKQNNILNNSITIGIIGNYVFDTLTEEMINKTQTFLQHSVENGKLDENYFLIAHNQTMNTLSPGDNVYREIKGWPHFKTEQIIPNL